MENDHTPSNAGDMVQAPAPDTRIFNQSKLKHALRQMKNPQRNEIRDVDGKQVTIMIYIYKNEKLSMKQLRSMMKLSDITSYRYGSRLTHLGLIKWKGSHRVGAYYLTEKGKEFVEKNG
jgi:predicted transcriptional regulator